MSGGERKFGPGGHGGLHPPAPCTHHGHTCLHRTGTRRREGGVGGGAGCGRWVGLVSEEGVADIRKWVWSTIGK